MKEIKKGNIWIVLFLLMIYFFTNTDSFIAMMLVTVLLYVFMRFILKMGGDEFVIAHLVLSMELMTLLSVLTAVAGFVSLSGSLLSYHLVIITMTVFAIVLYKNKTKGPAIVILIISGLIVSWAVFVAVGSAMMGVWRPIDNIIGMGSWYLVILLLCIGYLNGRSLTYDKTTDSSGVIDNDYEIEDDLHYYISSGGKCYHCSRLCAGSVAYEVNEEVARKMRPCSRCVPKDFDRTYQTHISNQDIKTEGKPIKMTKNNSTPYIITIVVLAVMLVAAIAVAIVNYSASQKKDFLIESTNSAIEWKEQQIDDLVKSNENLQRSNETLQKELDESKELCKSYKLGNTKYYNLIANLKAGNCGWASDKFYTKRPILLLNNSSEDIKVPIVSKIQGTLYFKQMEGRSAYAEWDTNWNGSETYLVIHPRHQSGTAMFEITNDVDDQKFRIIAIQE